MGLNSSLLPEHILTKMSPEDRKPLGKAGVTADEAREKQMARDEKEAQSQIRSFLRLKEIEFICPDMRKKSPLPEGWPDFTLAYRKVPLTFEVKVWGVTPRSEQVARHERLRKAVNGWRVYVVTGVADVQAIFRSIDAEIEPRPVL